MFVAAVTIVSAVAATVYDLSQLKVQGDGAVSASYTENKASVQISNSDKIITPWVQYGYSAYLNHFSKYKDYFKGSTRGMMYEWSLHNLGAAGFRLISLVDDDSKWQEYIDRCKDVDIGPTIFDDSVETHGLFSSIMKGSYSLLFPMPALYDYYQYKLE